MIFDSDTLCTSASDLPRVYTYLSEQSLFVVIRDDDDSYPHGPPCAVAPHCRAGGAARGSQWCRVRRAVVPHAALILLTVRSVLPARVHSATNEFTSNQRPRASYQIVGQSGGTMCFPNGRAAPFPSPTYYRKCLLLCQQQQQTRRSVRSLPICTAIERNQCSIACSQLCGQYSQYNARTRHRKPNSKLHHTV